MRSCGRLVPVPRFFFAPAGGPFVGKVVASTVWQIVAVRARMPHSVMKSAEDSDELVDAKAYPNKKRTATL